MDGEALGQFQTLVTHKHIWASICETAYGRFAASCSLFHASNNDRVYLTSCVWVTCLMVSHANCLDDVLAPSILGVVLCKITCAASDLALLYL